MLERLKRFLGLEKQVDKEKITSIFKARYAIFNDLLQCNSNLATIIANMGAVLKGERNADTNQIRKDARQAIVECERMANIIIDAANENGFGPRTAATHMPTTSQWKNVRLKDTKRQILAEEKNNHNKLSTKYGDNLPIFDYSGRAARLITAQEVAHITGADVEIPFNEEDTNVKFYFDSN